MQNLPDQLTSTKLFEAFKKQLIKDCDQSNFPSVFVEALEPEYSRTHAAIALELQGNESRSDFNVMNLLNRIDISEAQLKRYLSEKGSQSYYDVISELIIKRVLQKVVIKQYYKSQTD